MKFLYLVIFALCFCACAISPNIKKDADTINRETPVFMKDTQHRTAFKMTFEDNGKEYNFLLLANGKDGYINFKFIGDFASVLASVNLTDGNFNYESISPLLEDDRIKQAFEEVLLALFAPEEQKNLSYKYYFKKGETLPYKLKQKSKLANKTFLFENYNGSVPQNITIKAKLNLIKIKLELLANE